MHFRQGIDATGAADEDLAVIFGIEVNEAFSFEHTVLQFHGTGESGLFINGEEALDSGVLEVGIGDGSECH